jgi:hypothetical protein
MGLVVCGSKCGGIIQDYRRENLALSGFVLQGTWGQLLHFLSTEKYISLMVFTLTFCFSTQTTS